MEITVTSSVLPFETQSRWEQGSPGGYVLGQMTLPPLNHCLVSLDCLQGTLNLPSPCRLYLPIFDGKGNRVKEKFKETSIGENSSKVILEVDGAEVWRTKVIGEGKEPQKDRIVARVNNKEGQPIIYLGMLSKWIPNVFSLFWVVSRPGPQASTSGAELLFCKSQKSIN